MDCLHDLSHTVEYLTYCVSRSEWSGANAGENRANNVLGFFVLFFLMSKRLTRKISWVKPKHSFSFPPFPALPQEEKERSKTVHLFFKGFVQPKAKLFSVLGLFNLFSLTWGQLLNREYHLKTRHWKVSFWWNSENVKKKYFVIWKCFLLPCTFFSPCLLPSQLNLFTRFCLNLSTVWVLLKFLFYYLLKFLLSFNPGLNMLLYLKSPPCGRQ